MQYSNYTRPARLSLRIMSLCAAVAAPVAMSHAADPSAGGIDIPAPVAEIILPYAGGPLPEAAINPPEGTVVKLQYVPGAPVATPPDGTNGTPAAQNVIVVPSTDGPLPDAALNPPDGSIVKLQAP
jgi:hypothetical protein